MTILAMAVRLHFAVLMGFFFYYFWSEHQIFRGFITSVYAIFWYSRTFLGFFFCLFREKKNSRLLKLIKYNYILVNEYTYPGKRP